MKTHVARVARFCFYHLRRLRLIPRNFGRDVTARLVSAFVISRMDYCNYVLAHLPASTLAPLQRVLNAAARLVMDLKPRDHVSPAPYELHWLTISERINFKLCILVHHAINGRGSSTIVFDWTGNFCRRHPWPCNTTLGSETIFICSANKSGLFRTNVFCCWTEGMEQITCWHQTHNRHKTF